MGRDRKGLAIDLLLLAAAMDRRHVLRLLGAATIVNLIGCGDDEGRSSCAVIPGETAGPYPGDGTNGANALALSGIVRSDIRSSIGDASGTAEGVALTVRLTLVDTGASCAPRAGHAIYIWHCDRGGDYSMYTGAAVEQNYLRGVQETDGDGVATFTTIFPGCYSGRWPHIHIAVYPSLASATTGASAVHTTQLALPADACGEAYAAAGYEQSASNLAATGLASDGVFGDDGAEHQLAEVSGSVDAGYAASLTLAIAA